MTIRKRIVRKLNTMYWSLRGATIGENSAINSGAEIGNPRKVRLGAQCDLGKQITLHCGQNGFFALDDHSHVAPYGYFLIDNNTVLIGHHVAIGPNCQFICHSNSPRGRNEFFTENYEDGDIRIGNNVFIGGQCVILPDSQIEDNVVVASNSVVRGLLKSGFVYGGSPAKQLKPLV